MVITTIIMTSNTLLTVKKTVLTEMRENNRTRHCLNWYIRYRGYIGYLWHENTDLLNNDGMRVIYHRR